MGIIDCPFLGHTWFLERKFFRWRSRRKKKGRKVICFREMALGGIPGKANNNQSCIAIDRANGLGKLTVVAA